MTTGSNWKSQKNRITSKRDDRENEKIDYFKTRWLLMWRHQLSLYRYILTPACSSAPTVLTFLLARHSFWFGLVRTSSLFRPIYTRSTRVAERLKAEEVKEEICYRNPKEFVNSNMYLCALCAYAKASTRLVYKFKQNILNVFNQPFCSIRSKLAFLCI